MSIGSPTNVVHLDGYDKSRKRMLPSDAMATLEDCRDLASERMAKSLAGMMDKVDDALFELAEKAENNSTQSTYFDAMREVRLKRPGIEVQFYQALREGFDRAMNRGTWRAEGTDGAGATEETELGLVGIEDLEESLAVENMVARAKTLARDELQALDKRLGSLLGTPELESRHNPLGPDCVCNAFQEACRALDTGIKIKLLIYKLFDRNVIEQVAAIYQALNARLIERKVLPNLPARTVARTVARASAPRVGLPGMPGLPAMPVAPQRAEAALAETAALSGEDLFATLASLFQARAAGAPGGLPAAGPVLTPFTADSPVYDILTLLQRGEPMVTADLLGSAAARGLADGRGNLLRALRGSGLSRALDPTGDMTLDIVAMMFDYILADRSIPDPMKSLIGRLQIPVLKVALLDKAVFSRKSHPVRRLLDRLAETAVHWSPDPDGRDPLYETVDGLVQTVIQRFEDDTGVFGEVLEELEHYLAGESDRVEAATAAAARLAEDREHLALARQTAREEVAQRLKTPGLPPVVGDFLERFWQDRMISVLTTHGTRGSAWKVVLETMDMLVWSVVPKEKSTERRRLLGLLPVLLQRLNLAMRDADLDPETRQAFLVELANLHAAAVRPPEAGSESEAAAGETDTAATTAPPLFAAAPAETAEAPATPQPEEAPVEDAYTQQARDLAIGAWVEIRDGETGLRARLTWISAATGTYLFTNRQGAKAAERSLQELAQDLRSGRIGVLDEVPLFDRAVSNLLGTLRAEGKAPPPRPSA